MEKVIFWDFDGTLAHSDSLWTSSIHKALDLYSKENKINIDEIRPYARSGFTWHNPENDYTELAKNLTWWTFMFNRFSIIYQSLGIDKDTADFISTKTRDLVLDINNYCLYEDTILTLKRCQEAGFDNYILSNNYPELADIIHKLQLSSYFKEYIISAKIGYEKPRKELFEYALNAANNPEVCYMVGDNPIADIEGANAVGIESILVHNNTICNAAHYCGNLRDVADLLEVNSK